MTANHGDVVITICDASRRSRSGPSSGISGTSLAGTISCQQPAHVGHPRKACTVRQVVTTGGTAMREQLEELDRLARVIGYRMLLVPTPMAEQHYLSVVAPTHVDRVCLAIFSPRRAIESAVDIRRFETETRFLRILLRHQIAPL